MEKLMGVSQLSFSEPAVNPFVNNLHLSTLQKIQIGIMTVFVIPVKVALIVLLFFVAWFFSFVATIGFRTPIVKPAGSFRVILFNTFGKIVRLFFFVVGFHRIKVTGKRVSCAEAPILIVAPHSSMLDLFVFYSTFPIPSGVSALEFLHMPFFGTLSKTLQPIYVNRHDLECRKNLALELKSRVENPSQWPQIIVFPEGTCTNRLALITFKLGAFAQGVPIQPVVINYHNNFDSFSWTYGGPSSIVLVWLSLCQISIKTSLAFLPAYYPNDEEKCNPKLYANNVRAIMAKAANLPCTEHSFEDCRLMFQAMSLNLPGNCGVVEYTKLNQKLGMDMKTIQNRLEEFSEIASDRSRGLVSIDDFANYLNLPKTPALQELFDLYDRSHSGFIDFREYVLGLSLISEPAATDSTIRLAFNFFDEDGNGRIGRERFNRMMQAAYGVELADDQLFNEIKTTGSGSVTFNDFEEFLKKKPEYAKLLEFYQKTLQEPICDTNNGLSLSTLNTDINANSSENFYFHLS